MPKKKNFLYSNEGKIDYNQQCHPLHLRNKQYKQFPQKKKKKKSANEKGREKRGNENEKERKREWEKEGEGEERRERERRGENGKSGTKNAPLPPDAFPSTKLGNNITPIKGRLGKNTTPTCRGASKPSRNP